MAKTIKLNEEQLRKVVKETIEKVLKEETDLEWLEAHGWPGYTNGEIARLKAKYGLGPKDSVRGTGQTFGISNYNPKQDMRGNAVTSWRE